LYKIKKELSVVQVKNKPCVIYIVMRLIPWIQSRGNETGILNRIIKTRENNELERWSSMLRKCPKRKKTEHCEE
jgi:hypothetical protein